MATADELKTFLEKRGFHVEVEKVASTFLIDITSKSVKDIQKILAEVNEPGRFIVAVKLSDTVPIIGEVLGIVKLKQDVAKLEEDMSRNTDNLTKTDDENKRQSEESLSSLRNKLDSLEEKVDTLVDKMSYIETQPWWKRFLGVK